MKIIIVSTLLFLFGCQQAKEKLAPFISGDAPDNLALSIRKVDGTRKFTLSPCNGEKRNCVASYKALNSEKHYLPPFEIGNQDKAQAYENMLKLLLKYKSEKVRLIKQDDGDYIHAEFTTTIGFVDDVEFAFKEKGKIHFRSASRIGHWDVNKNKNRIEAIRFKFQQRDF